MSLLLDLQCLPYWAYLTGRMHEGRIMLSDRPSFVARISDDIPLLLLIYSAKPAGLARSHVTGGDG